MATDSCGSRVTKRPWARRRGGLAFRLLFVAFVGPEVSDGATIRVPGDVPEIQRAIDLAKSGDTVLVAPGDYDLEEPLLLPAKGIVLRSESGPDETRLISSQDASLIRIVGESREEGEISGFSLIGGLAGIEERAESGSSARPRLRVSGNRFADQRKAILTETGIGSIEENVIEGCWEGIHAAGSQAVIQGNRIRDCAVGILLRSPGIISDNVVEDSPKYGIQVSEVHGPVEIKGNRVRGNGLSGVFALFQPGTDDRLVIRENEITGNGSDQEGGSDGGGIYFEGVGGVITGNLIAENRGQSGSGIFYRGADALIEGNTIVGNLGRGTGGVCLFGVAMEMRRNIIAYNKVSMGRGGGVWALYERQPFIAPGWLGPITLAWNTVAFNEARFAAGGIHLFRVVWRTVDYSVHHSIIWGNWNRFGEVEFCSYPFDCSVLDYLRYSCLRRPRSPEGEGNFSADPLFVDAEAEDFRLLPGSPCIDAGDPEAERDPDGTRADIGAIPFDHTDPVFLRGDCTGDGIVDLGDAISSLMYLFSDGTPACPKAADTNDDGALDMGDAIALLMMLFAGGAEPRPPYPRPGTDPTPDGLPCGPSW